MALQEEIVRTSPVTGTTTQVTRVTDSSVDPNLATKEARVAKHNQVIWYIVGIINIILALRLVFSLLGARTTGFADFLYSVSDPLVAPFRGIFPAVQASGSYFDTAALVAIVVYTLIAWALAALLDLIERPASVS